MLTLDSPLDYNHFAGIDTFSATDFIEMRAEVGLLTRNILYRGDPDSSIEAQYGATIMLYKEKGNTVTGRIEYAEFQYVG